MRRTMNSRPLWAPVTATIAGLLGGCAVGPNYQAPQVPVEPQFTAKTNNALAVTEPISERWWQNFNDPVLNELVSRADMQNIDLRRTLLRSVGAPRPTRQFPKQRMRCSIPNC